MTSERKNPSRWNVVSDRRILNPIDQWQTAAIGTSYLVLRETDSQPADLRLIIDPINRSEVNGFKITKLRLELTRFNLGHIGWLIARLDNEIKPVIRIHGLQLGDGFVQAANGERINANSTESLKISKLIGQNRFTMTDYELADLLIIHLHLKHGAELKRVYASGQNPMYPFQPVKLKFAQLANGAGASSKNQAHKLAKRYVKILQKSAAKPTPGFEVTSLAASQTPSTNITPGRTI